MGGRINFIKGDVHMGNSESFTQDKRVPENSDCIVLQEIISKLLPENITSLLGFANGLLKYQKLTGN